MTIVIPGQLPGLNEYIRAERSNRQAAAAMKRDAEDLIMLHARLQHPGAHFAGPVYMRYTWVETDRRRDFDNIAFAKKFVQDALVKARILDGDGQKFVAGFTDEFRVDKNNSRVIVEILESGKKEGQRGGSAT